MITTTRNRLRLLDPLLGGLSPRHVEIFWRYQVVRTGVGFAAAACFVVGSICFFFDLDHDHRRLAVPGGVGAVRGEAEHRPRALGPPAPPAAPT